VLAVELAGLWQPIPEDLLQAGMVVTDTWASSKAKVTDWKRLRLYSFVERDSLTSSKKKSAKRKVTKIRLEVARQGRKYGYCFHNLALKRSGKRSRGFDRVPPINGLNQSLSHSVQNGDLAGSRTHAIHNKRQSKRLSLIARVCDLTDNAFRYA